MSPKHFGRAAALSLLAVAYIAVPARAQVVRIDCGSTANYIASDGTVWLADQNFVGGNRYYTGYAIAGTADAGLYNWSRTGYYGDFSYSIPVPNGAYKLTLKFAETQYFSAGQRVFNVFVNGTQVVDRLDLVASVGALKAMDQLYSVQITNGALLVEVKGVVNVGILNGIQLVPDNSSQPAILQVTGGPLTFSGAAGGSNPAQQSAIITNGGGSTLSWTAAATQPWVILPVTQGTGPTTLSVGVSTAGLAQGTYTDTLTISAPGISGSPATLNLTLNVGPAGPLNSASFVKLNGTTSGNWQNSYGGDGYSFVGAPPALPSYAQMAVNGGSTYTWSGLTSDSRALQLLSGGGRIAATWYSSTPFSFDLNLTGGSHQTALYMLDYDRSNRAERIDILDAGTNALLDTQTINNFQPGQYLVWNLTGHVIIRVTPLSGPNAVVSGIFFGGPLQQQAPPAPVLSLSTGGLTFSATAGGAVPASQNLGISNTGGGALNWSATKTQSWLTLSAASGTGPATLSVGVATGLPAGTYIDTITVSSPGAAGSPATVGVTLNLTSPNTPVLTLSTSSMGFSATGTGGNPASQPISISNTGGGTLNWSASKTQSWVTLSAASGTGPSSLSIGVDIGALAAGTYNDVVTVIAAGATGSPATVDVNLVVGGNNSVSFVKLDGTSQGTWKNTYGSDGYSIVGIAPSVPGYAQLTPTGASTFIWSASNSETRALQQPSGSSRIASTWYSSTPFSFDVNVTDGAAHQIAAYLTDYDNAGRSERIDVLDGGNGTLLDTHSLSGFFGGQYLVWNITGHVVIRVIPLAGPNGLVNGIFFGGASQSGALSPVLTLSSNGASFSGAAGGANPASQTLTISNTGSGALNWTAAKTQSWLTLSSSSGAAPSALSLGVNTAGLAAGIYTDTITITSSGASGSPATVTVTLNLGGNTAVTFVQTDSTTSGNWKNAYGAEAYDFVGATPQLPAWLQVGASGASTFIWSGSSAETRALQQVTGTSRVAAVWYASNSFTLDVNLGDGNSHQLALYASDYDGAGRVERIDVLDGVTGQLLDSHQLSLFQPGQYLVWNMTGHVLIRVTRISGPNAVVNGIFVGTAFQLTLPPVLTLSTSNLHFSAIAGGTSPVAQNVAITNAGGGALNWTAAKTAQWISLSAASGTAPSNLDIGLAIAGLTPGSYTDTVTIDVAGVNGSPQSIAVTLQVAAPSAVGAIANWTFETATVTANSVLDTSGNSMSASIIGAPVPGPGAVGQALTFDGSTSYLQTQPDPRPAMTGDLTLTAWIKTTNSSRTETILSKYDVSGTEDGYIFETTAAGFLALHLGGSNINGTRDTVDGVNKINDGNWHHVAAIIRPGQDISFYVDGGLSSVYYLTTFGGAIGPPVVIAGPANLVAGLFTGSIDEVRIYGHALSTSEIAQLYGSTVTTAAGGEQLYNGIVMPKNFPPTLGPTQALRIPYYINNPPRVLPIDTGRQLFVDDFLIEQTSLQRTPHQPSIAPSPVLTPGSPISGGAWFDPLSQRYQMWYYNTTNDYRYAYSTDGKNWTLPTYPDVLMPGTNEVVTGGDTVWLDPQETDPSRRYKSFGVDVGAGKIYAYFSPDGIHFGPRQDYGIKSISDRSSVFYNAFRKVWVNSDRGSAGLPATALRAQQDTRVRFYSESKNLTTWTPADPSNTFWTGPDDHDPPYYLNNPGGQPPELYNLDAVAYESVMVGMFSWFYPGIGYKNYTLPGPILVEVGVGFSRDGFSWVRPTRDSGPNGAFIPASNLAGTWNAYNTQSVGGAFLVVGDELWFYFSGRSLQKPLDGNFSTGLATLRRDGFYSMDAGATPGSLVTHPLSFSGSHLFVNVNDPSGQLTVDVLDANGSVIPGFSAADCLPVSIDKTRQEITWGGRNLATLVGQNTKFRFNLTNGSLYSFWVTASAQGASNGYVAAGGPGFAGPTDTVGSAGHP